MKSTAAVALLLVVAFNSSADAQTKPAAPSAAAAPSTAAPVARSGLWEITIAEQVVNSTNKRNTLSRICLGPDDVKIAARVIPAQRSLGMHCDNLGLDDQGTTLTWKVACKGKEGSINGAATMTLAAESYVAQVKLDSRVGSKAGKLEQTITGKRVGDCK